MVERLQHLVYKDFLVPYFTAVLQKSLGDVGILTAGETESWWQGILSEGTELVSSRAGLGFRVAAWSPGLMLVHSCLFGHSHTEKC